MRNIRKPSSNSVVRKNNSEKLNEWGYEDSGFYFESKESNMIGFKGGRYQLTRCAKLYGFIVDMIGYFPPTCDEFGDYDLNMIPSRKLESQYIDRIKLISETSIYQVTTKQTF